MSLRPIAKALLACCACLPLMACTTVAARDAPAPPPAGAQAYTLHPGEQVALASRGSLRYVRLVSDSRCAPDVQCIWAGDAEVAFQWIPATGAPRAFSLHTGLAPRKSAVDGQSVTLVALARGPRPEATVRVDPAGTP